MASTAYQYATGEGGIGLEAMNQNIRDFFANAPTEEATRAAMAQYGVSDEDIRRATGKVFGDYFPTGGLSSVSAPQDTVLGGLAAAQDTVTGALPDVVSRMAGQDTVSGGLSVAGSIIPGMDKLVGVDQLALGYNKDATNAANAQNIANQLYAQGQGLIGKTISGDLATQLNSALNPTYFEGEGGLMPTSSSVFSPVRKQVGTDNEGNPIYEDTGTYSAFLNAHDIGNKGTLLGQQVTVDKDGNIIDVQLRQDQRGSFQKSIAPLLNFGAMVVTGGAAGLGLSPLQAAGISTALRAMGGADVESLIKNAVTSYGVSTGLDMAAGNIASSLNLDPGVVRSALDVAYTAAKSDNPYDIIAAGMRGLASGFGRDTPTGGTADYGDINTQGQERGVNERTYSEDIYDALIGAMSGAQGEQSLADKEQTALVPGLAAAQMWLTTTPQGQKLLEQAQRMGAAGAAFLAQWTPVYMGLDKPGNVISSTDEVPYDVAGVKPVSLALW